MALSTLNQISIVWIAIAIAVFFVNFKIKAPYGRHTKYKNWGPMVDNKWAWFAMEIPALLVLPLIFLLSESPKSTLAWFLVILWTLHYIHRTFIYPFRIKTAGKKMPLSIPIMAIFFNSINGLICGYYLANFVPVTTNFFTQSSFILGFLLFTSGMLINLHSDNILINLRKVKSGYSIPFGGFFRWFSSPNLLGEMIEWLGFALMCWSLPVLSFSIWTMANLIPRAKAHHEWYREKFEDYPVNRCVLIPGVW